MAEGRVRGFPPPEHAKEHDMNKIFRLIWSAAKDKWVVVAETVKNRGSLPSLLIGSAALMAAVLSGALPGWALDPGALPSGGRVTSGQATIATSGNRMTVNQSSQQMIANWNSFNIGQNAAVQFNQPNAGATALNRINDQNPTQILGSLSANGKVFLLNPAGIIFGQGSQVNVGGLVASSLNMLDSDFLAGKHRFSNPGNSGSIINQGSITANGGVVALIAPKVQNEGTITTNNGTTLLAAGNQVSLDFAGDGLISYTIDQGAVDALAQNSGLIKADGGMVVMTAKAADSLTTAVVNNTGVIEARTLKNKNGRIILMGDMEHGETIVGGTLDASAPNGGNGGFIETSAATVTTLDSLKVTAGAASGTGGLWLIDPYDYTIGAAQATTIKTALDSGTSVTVDTSVNTSSYGSSGTSTNAGNITVTSAIGKTAGGDATLTLKANQNILIKTASQGISSSSGKLNVVLWADQDNANGGSVWLENVSLTTNGGHVWIGGGSGSTTWNGLTVGNGYSNSTYTSSASNGGSWEGVLLRNATTITTSGGNVAIYGKNNRDINAADGRVGIYIDSNSSISTDAGSILLDGLTTSLTQNAPDPNVGVMIKDSSLSSTTGAVSISGTQAGNAMYAAGVWIYRSDVKSTVGGAISITGSTDSDNASGWKNGILVWNDGAATKSISTTSGDITINGTVNTTSRGDASGVELNVSNNMLRIISQTGNISITGNNPNDTDTSDKSRGIRLVGSNTSGKLYLGYDGTNAFSGNLSLVGRDIGIDGFATGNLFMQGSGSLTIAPIGTSFTVGSSATTSTFDTHDSVDFGSSHSTITIGKDGNAADLLISRPMTTLPGPVNIYGGNVELNGTANITTTAAGASGTALIKANGYIHLYNGIDIATNGAGVTLWADADNNQTGYIQTAGTSGNLQTITTGGGTLTMGGGATANGTITSKDNYRAIDLNYSSINTGAKDIVLNGSDSPYVGDTNYSSGIALTNTSLTTTGNVTLNGTGSIAAGDYASGVLLAGSTITSPGAISITGTSGRRSDNTGAYQIGVGIKPYNSVNSQITATGGGTITINGTSNCSASTDAQDNGIRIDSGQTNPLSTAGGHITLNGTSGNGITSPGVTINSPISTAGPFTVNASSLTMSGSLTLTGNGNISFDTTDNSNGSMVVSAPISKTGGGDATLTARSGGRVSFGGATITDSSASGKLDVVLWADYNSSATKSYGINVPGITTKGGNVWIGASAGNKTSDTWNGLAVGDGPAVGSALGNWNAIDWNGLITTAGGNVKIWAGTPVSYSISANTNGGATGINAGTGNILMIADTINWNNGSGGAMPITTTGAFTFLPNSANWGTQNIFTADFNFSGATLSGLTIGKDIGTLDMGSGTITLNTAQTVNGPISIFGGNIHQTYNVINSSASGTAADRGILYRASGQVWLGPSIKTQTNGGDITLWSNAAVNTATSTSKGGIYLENSVTLDSRTAADRPGSHTTGGGAITLGGGSATTTTANGTTVPSGYALNYGTYAAGLILGSYSAAPAASANIAIYSGGGNISLRGRSTQVDLGGTYGIATYEGLNVDAGTTGNITIVGAAENPTITTSSCGIDFQSYRNGKAPSKIKTANGTISITGTTTSTNAAGVNLSAFSDAMRMTVEATGTGAINITGASQAGTSAGDIRLKYDNILAASGPITFTTTGTANYFNSYGGVVIGAKASTDVTTSTSNVTISANQLKFQLDSGFNSQIDTKGALALQPYGTAFDTTWLGDSTLNWTGSGSNFALTGDLANLTVNNFATLGGLTLGKDGMTTHLSVDNDVTIKGSINLYANDVTINANLNTTTAGTGGSILAKASRDIVQNSGKSVTTSDGNVTYWADSDGTGGGAIFIDRSTITSGGGAITMSGGSDIATGYAQGRDSVANLSNGITILGATLNSGNGDIILRGKGATTYATSDANLNQALGIVIGTSKNALSTPTLIDSGTGKIAMAGVSAASVTSTVAIDTGASYHAIELGSNSSALDAADITVKSASTAADAISITADASALTSSVTNLLMQGTGFQIWNAATTGRDVIIAATAGGIVINGKASQSANVQSEGNGVRVGGNGNGLEVVVAAGPITFTGQGNANLSGSNDIQLDNARVGYSSGSDVTASSGNITLNADTMAADTNSKLQSSGTLTIQPKGISTSIGLGTGSGTLKLDATTLSTIQPGFATINIGRSDGLGIMTLGGATSIAATNSSTNVNLRAGSFTDSGSNVLNVTNSGKLNFQANNGNIGSSSDSIDFVAGTATVNTTGSGSAYITSASSYALGASNVGSGTLSIGATGGAVVTQSGAATAGTLKLAATGSVTLNDANNDFSTVNGTVSDLTLRDKNGIDVGALTASTFNLTAAGNVTASGALNSGLVTLNLGSNDAALNYAGTNFTGGVTGTARNLTLRDDTGGLSLGSASPLTLSGNLNVTSSGGAIVQGGTTAVTGTTTLNAGANAITLANTGNNFTGAVSITAGAAVQLTLTGDLHLGNASVTSITAIAGAGGGTPGAGDLYIDSGATITASGAGTAVVLVAGDNTSRFVNNAGANAINLTTGGSRWLVYTNNPYSNGDQLGGLLSNNTAVFGKRYPVHSYTGAADYAPGSVLENGNRYVLAMPQSAIPGSSANNVTITTLNTKKTYGDLLTLTTTDNSTISFATGTTVKPEFSESAPAWLDVAGLTLGSSGLPAAAHAGLYDMTATGSIKVNAVVQNVGSLSTSGTSAWTYTDGTRTVTLNDFGSVNVTARVLTLALAVSGVAANKVYDGTTTGSFSTAPTFTLSNIVNSDTVGIAGSAIATFSDKNVGNSKNVTLSGLSSSNSDYVLPVLPTYTADITKRNLTVAVTAQNKTYDGLTNASVTLGPSATVAAGTSGSGLIIGDTVTYGNDGASFDNRNAGNGKTVTVSFIGIGGADAANYTLTSTTATTTANIDKRTISLSSLTGSKTYNGTTALNAPAFTLDTGNIISGDAITGVTGAATFDNKNAGTGKTLTANLADLTLNGGDAGNYTLGAGSYVGSGSITPKAITLTAGSVTKTYDGSTGYTVQAADLTALSSQLGVGGDSVTAATITFADKNAGTGAKVVTLDNATISDGNSGGNYTITLDGNSASTIDKRTVTISASKTYDGTAGLTGSQVSIGNIVAGEDLNYTGATANSKNVGAGNYISAITLNDGTAGSAGNYTLPTLDNSNAPVTINKASLTVTAATYTKTYDGTVTSSGTLTVGTLVSGDSVNSAPTQAFLSKNVGAGKTLRASGLTVKDGSSADMTGNYDIIYVDDISGTINLKTASVTGTATTPTYNGATQNQTAATTSGFIGSDDITVSGLASGKNAGTYTSSLTVGGADKDNYNVTVTNADLTIGKKDATVTANSATVTYNGQTQSVSGFTATGLMNGETVSALSGVTESGGSGKNAVSYTHSASGSDSNYNLAFVDGNLSIAKASLTISAVSETKTYDGTQASSATPTHTALATGDSISTLSETFDSKNASTTNGRTLTVGFYTITDGNSGNNYNVTVNTATGTITKCNLGIDLKGQGSKVYDGTNSITLSGITPSLLGAISGDTVALGAGNVTGFVDKNAGNAKPINFTGFALSGIDAGNYTLTSGITYSTANISKANATVTANSASFTYNGQTQSVSGFTATGLVNGETANALTGVTESGGSGKNAGSYTHSASGSESNYNLAFVDGNLSIAKASLTISAVSDSKTYDGTQASSAIPTHTALATGDSISSLSETFDSKNVGSGKTLNVSGYTITDGNSGNNYDITLNTATGTINQKAASVTGTATTLTYNGVTQNQNAATTSGFIGGDAIIVSGLASGRNAGSYTSGLTVGGADKDNYNVTVTNADLTINKKDATVTANSAAVTYNGQTQTVSGFTATGLVIGETANALSGVTESGGSGRNAGSYTHSASGSDSNYNLAFVDGNLTINKASLTISAVTDSKTYDGTPSSGAIPTHTTLATDDSISSLNETFDSKNASSGKTLNVNGYTITDGNSGNNYNVITVADTTGVVTPALLTYAATSASFRSGESLPVFSGSVTGFVNGETLAGVTTGTVQWNTPAASNSPAGSYSINGSGLSANNSNYLFIQNASNNSALTIQTPNNPPVLPAPAPPPTPGTGGTSGTPGTPPPPTFTSDTGGTSTGTGGTPTGTGETPSGTGGTSTDTGGTSTGTGGTTTGTGGTPTGTGGTSPGTGGTPSTGGIPGTGGTPGTPPPPTFTHDTGGTPGTGGTSDTVGATGTGGTPASGGTSTDTSGTLTGGSSTDTAGTSTGTGSASSGISGNPANQVKAPSPTVPADGSTAGTGNISVSTARDLHGSAGAGTGKDLDVIGNIGGREVVVAGSEADKTGAPSNTTGNSARAGSGTTTGQTSKESGVNIGESGATGRQVTVLSRATDNKAFEYTVTKELVAALPPVDRNNVTAVMEDGEKLPLWLSFDRNNLKFTSENVPPGSLPLTVIIVFSGQGGVKHSIKLVINNEIK